MRLYPLLYWTAIPIFATAGGAAAGRAGLCHAAAVAPRVRDLSCHTATSHASFMVVLSRLCYVTQGPTPDVMKHNNLPAPYCCVSAYLRAPYLIYNWNTLHRPRGAQEPPSTPRTGAVKTLKPGICSSAQPPQMQWLHWLLYTKQLICASCLSCSAANRSQ